MNENIVKRVRPAIQARWFLRKILKGLCFLAIGIVCPNADHKIRALYLVQNVE